MSSGPTGPGHDPERFYHCDCIESRWTPDPDADLRAERDRLKLEVEARGSALIRIWERTRVTDPMVAEIARAALGAAK